MTPKKEDYLKIIFELGGTKKKVSNKQIAMSLNVAAGSVTEMVNKLVKEGLAAHTPYAGISLTDEGIEVAEILEHVASDKLMKKLDQFLNSPRECPHGGVIPTEAGEYEEESHEYLAEIKVGETVEVDRFIDNHELLTYLDDLELKLGDKIEVLEHLPFEGPIKVKRLADGAELSIGYKAAHYIFVK